MKVTINVDDGTFRILGAGNKKLEYSALKRSEQVMVCNAVKGAAQAFSMALKAPSVGDM